jgi:hypothetical protein
MRTPGNPFCLRQIDRPALCHGAMLFRPSAQTAWVFYGTTYPLSLHDIITSVFILSFS